MPSTFINRADEVLPGLWIGDARSCAAAYEVVFNSLCALGHACGTPHCHDVRILSLKDGAAMPELLDAAANVIDRRWANLNPPLLVDRGAGAMRISSNLFCVQEAGRKFTLT